MKAIVRCSILLAVFLVGMTVSSADACVPTDADGLLCMPRQLQMALASKPPAQVSKTTSAPANVAAVPAARGTGPHDAMEPSDVWLTINANAALWYKIGSGLDPQRLMVWLDTHGKENVNFAVYSPEQMNDWSPATPPKGRGARDRTNPAHDLQWIGQAPAGGVWFVVITNGNSVPVQYRLTYNRIETGRKSCNSYWESLFGRPFYWTWCE